MMADERDSTIDGVEAGDDVVAERDIDRVMDESAADGNDPVEQLRDLVAWLIGELIDEPDAATIEAVERGSSVQIQVRLPEDDLGKVIGRGGRIAKAIRTALSIAGSRHHLRVSLDIEAQD